MTTRKLEYINTKDNAKIGILGCGVLELATEQANGVAEAMQILRQRLNALMICCEPEHVKECRGVVDDGLAQICELADALAATIFAATTAEAAYRGQVSETELASAMMEAITSPARSQQDAGPLVSSRISMADVFRKLSTANEAGDALTGSSPLATNGTEETQTVDTGSPSPAAPAR